MQLSFNDTSMKAICGHPPRSRPPAQLAPPTRCLLAVGLGSPTHSWQEMVTEGKQHLEETSAPPAQRWNLDEASRALLMKVLEDATQDVVQRQAKGGGLLRKLEVQEDGDETVFPSSTTNSSSSPFYNELSECAKGGLSVKPKMGDAILFWSMKPDGSLDPTSLHGGCPVIKGNKWSSTKWMRVHEYKV
ncbi:putative prolyl 4-hydroxylase 10 [Zea mays]|uniref:Putative prolyl 4-hydroxylase 10 n=1 Tax=Zea mays TaxID=4577 RepID=A0A3L6DH52_MAIZE|nr:putative prolyl 4-hydroxylase 10 [Zea mays]